jgi:glutamate-1-semialdehyde 2,1-aminomutase
VAAAAGLATIKVLEEPGFYDKLHEKSQQLTSALQEVLDRHGLPVIAAGERSFWQILFMTGKPHNQTDIMASDQVRMRELDLELLRRGIYVLPGVRRFVCAVNSDEDFDDTVGALDAACKAIN